LALWGIPEFARIGAILGFAGYLTLVNVVFIASLRYRLPIEPFMIMFAAIAAIRLARRWPRGKAWLAAVSMDANSQRDVKNSAAGLEEMGLGAFAIIPGACRRRRPSERPPEGATHSGDSPVQVFFAISGSTCLILNEKYAAGLLRPCSTNRMLRIYRHLAACGNLLAAWVGGCPCRWSRSVKTKT